MLKRIVLTIAVMIAAVLVIKPYQGLTVSQIDKINNEIKQLQTEINRKALEKREAERNAQVLTGRKQATKEDIEALTSQINTVGVKLIQTERQIAKTEEKLQLTGQELEEAFKRQKETGEKMDSQVRLMYTNGAVSYLDVLMSSTSISDFLNRYDVFQSIFGQTRNLLDENTETRALVEQKKAEVAKELQQVKVLYEQMAETKAELESKESAKESMLAIFDEQIENMGEISEESEEELMELAKKMAKLQSEKSRIKTYYKGGKLAMPLKSSYRLSSPFGNRIHPISGKNKLHAGMDMAAPSGTPIYAAESGVVIVSQWWSGYGNTVIIDHGGGLWTLYPHVKNGGLLVERGDTVKRGEKIALVGSTGNSTGPHLHFEVRKNSVPVNPAPYLK